MFKNESLARLGVIIQNDKGLAMAVVGSRFSDRAHYNEFVENESKSWALMRRRLVLEVKNTQNRTGNVPRRKDPSPEDGNSQLHSHPRSLSPFFGPSSSSPVLPALGDLCCYISLSSVHPPPTLVSHPCPYSSARPISHYFWRSVSCCGPHRTIQGSHLHQWGQGISCGYLIRR